MKKTAWIVIVSVLLSNVAWAQTGSEDWMRTFCQQNKDAPGLAESCAAYLPPETHKWLSPKTVGVGLIATIAGFLMILGPGTTYNVLGDDYCVSDYSVEYGSCYDPTLAKYGALTMGAGILMMYIGTRKVAIKPQISKSGVGAAVTVKWGKK